MGSVTYAWETAPTSTIDGPVVSLTHFYTYILIYIYVYYIYTYIYIYIHISCITRVSHRETEKSGFPLSDRGPRKREKLRYTGMPHTTHTSENSHPQIKEQRTKRNKQTSHSFIDWSDFWMVWYGL